MKRLITMILLVIFTFSSYASDGTNLIINPGFEQGRQGWDELWVRERGKGSMEIFSYTEKPGGMVLKVTYTGNRDWSVGQAGVKEVSPGEVYGFFGWVRCTDVKNSVQLSVVLYDKKGEVINWMYGLQETSGTHGWKRLDGRFIIPRGCAGIRFRITGAGKGVCLWDDLSLVQLKEGADTHEGKTTKFMITSWGTTLVYESITHLLTIQSRGHSREYTIRCFDDSVFITGIKTNDNAIIFSIQNIYYGSIIAVLTITGHHHFSFSLEGKGIMETDFSFPAGIFSTFPGRTNSTLAGGNHSTPPRGIQADVSQAWVIPNNEGFLIPTDDPNFSPSYRYLFYEGHGGFSMPFIGLTDGKEGIIFISETPDDQYAEYHHPGETGTGISTWSLHWEPQKGIWGYERRIIVQLVYTDGYVGIAKAYREYAKARGLLVTLEEKKKSVPVVDRLIGAADVWWWKQAEWWTRETHCGEIAGELYNAGLTKVLWSNAASPQAIREMNKLGFLTSRYDIYQDVWDPDVGIEWLNTEGWPGDLVLDKTGSRLRGWVHRQEGKEYPGGVICSQPGFLRMKETVSRELQTHPYKGRFIDTTTASPLRECYNPRHPLSRTGDRGYKSALLGHISGEFHLVTGSETGIDWAVPYVHYFEGMMSPGRYRLKDAGYDLVSPVSPDEQFLRYQVGPYYRIPLFELVYHDCVVSYWYWGDSSNRIPRFWRTRDLFNLLYGTGPLYIMDPGRWKKYKDRFVESYTTATMVSRAAGYAEMISHEFLTDDHTVQTTLFGNGIQVWVNFGDDPYSLGNGEIIGPEGYVVRKKNPG